MEDIHKSHNANGVLRSCEGFGIQDVHIIENNTQFDSEKTVSIGAHNWLSLYKYNHDSVNNIDQCFNNLRSKGYKIIATSPHEEDSNIDDLDISKKTALVFGTELKGVSGEVKNKVDGFVKIPMNGFSESFNISVSAAICMYELTKKMRVLNISSNLTYTYKTMIRYQWIKQTIKAGDKLVEKFIKDNDFECIPTFDLINSLGEFKSV